MLRIDLAPMEQASVHLPGMPGWMSGLLWSRGVRTPEEAQSFLHPSMDQILPALALHQMGRAVSLLWEAKEQGKHVAVYGDYDVDGVCASAILKETLERMGVSCHVYIPDRHQEGYGLNLAAVEKLAQEAQVLVTVDCGITSVGEVSRARELGMTVIVTDHHRHGETLPPADAVVSPLLGDYPFPYLCGAGVAWKLALALMGDQALPLMELAALATVADMVSLTGENRAIVALGLKQLSATGRPGLRALLNRDGVFGQVSSEQVGFQIAPRMNACGRLESAGIALDMLTTRDPARAEELALKMEGLNQERKNQENRVLNEALAQVERMDLVASRAIVVIGEGWNSGVVGLAAGRIAEKYAYPTVVLAREGEMCVGSARSAGDIDIHHALSQCAELFERFGGHMQAAGLTMRADRTEELARRLSQAVSEQTGGLPPVPRIFCDGEMTLADVTEDTVHWLGQLEPCGVGNPAPRFLCRDARPLSLRAVGAEGRHLKCTFMQDGELRDGILFGGGQYAGQDAGHYQLVITPTLNEFRGRVTAECRLHAVQLLPDTLQKNGSRERLAYLNEALDGEEAEAIPRSAVSALMAGGQGTLLMCRCLETAKEWRAQYPDADFRLEAADDPRAYHTILLEGAAAKTCASYRYVILCDGDLGEAGAYRRACPGARVYALPQTPEARGMLAGMYVDAEGLRAFCRYILRQRPREAAAWAAAEGRTEEQGLFAFRVLSEIGLLQRSEADGSLGLAPGLKRGPEESALFRRVRQAKEGLDGVYGL